MGETKEVKVKFSTIICIIVIILLIAGCGALYYFGFIEKDKKISELESEATKLKAEIAETKNSLEATEKESKEKAKKEVYKAAIENQSIFIDYLISEKDFNEKEFTDKEIIKALPYSSEQGIFSEYNEYENERGFFDKASISDVEKSAKSIFGKSIDVKGAEDEEAIIIEGEDVIVAVVSGFGVIKDETISTENTKGNEYIIEFKHINGENDGTYKLTVDYEDGNVIYKALEK